MKAVLFVGPSMPDGIKVPEGIEVLPPATAGDVFRAVRRSANLIALVDARFQDLQTVRHKEILYALEQGVHVWGAASMGALRAAECAVFGMRGFGQIFRDYHDNVITDDHEVALVHGPAELGYPALSEPMVNVRATMATAQTDGVVSPAEAEAILTTAQAMYYRDLTWAALGEAMDDAILGDRVAALAALRVDQKKADAAELIAAIANAAQTGLPPLEVSFQLQCTHHWKAHERRFSSAEDALSDVEASVLDELRLDPVRFREMLLRAFARRAVADGQDANAPGPNDPALVDGLRTDLGLGAAAEFRRWLEANEMTDARLGEFLALDEALEQAIEYALPDLAGKLVDDLRAEGLFIKMRDRAEAKSVELAGRSHTVPDTFAEFDLRDLLSWFCQSRRLEAPIDDPDAAARSLGLPDRAALHRLLRREFEFQNAEEKVA